MAESMVPEDKTSPSAQQQQTPDHDGVFRDYSGPPKSPTAKPKKVQISDMHQGKEEKMDNEVRISKEDMEMRQDLAQSGQSELQKSIDQSSQKLDFSGLSGVSDILGEMLLRGDMTAQQLGLSQRQANHLVDKARTSITCLSQEELQQIFAKKPSADKPHSEEQIKELHHWMAEKQKEQLKQYKDELNQLRAAEHHPFKSCHPQESPRERQNKDHVEKKKQQSEEFLKKREEEASRLMGDILADLSAVPAIVSSPTTPRREKTTKTHTPRSLTRTDKKSVKGIAGKTVVRKIFRSPAGTSHSPSPLRDRSGNVQNMDRTDLPVEDYIHLWGDHETGVIDSRTKLIRPRGSGDVGSWIHQQEETRPTSAPTSPPRARKQKKLTDLVRLQRPEVTRQTRHNKPKPLTYTERLAQLQADASTTRTTSSVREQHMIYGSRRLPGSARLTERKAPRVVKTYTERLSELRQYGERADAADTATSRLQNVQHRGISPRKPGKTLTYSERLQQLQPPKGTPRSSTDSIKLQPKPGYKWHKAPHKPKTYVEQLQELQKPATGRLRDTYNLAEPMPGRSAVRSRPYGDPYTEADDDRLSIVSPWSIEEDVRRLLYEEDSIMERFSAAASEAGMSEISEIEYYIGDEPEDYADLVDVGELADIASISEASVMSFIDWDQVDQLIAEA